MLGGAALMALACGKSSTADDDAAGATSGTGGAAAGQSGSFGGATPGGNGAAAGELPAAGNSGTSAGNAQGGSAGERNGGAANAGSPASAGTSGGGTNAAGASGAAGAGMGGGPAGHGGQGAGGMGLGGVPVDVGAPQMGQCTAPCQLDLEATGDLPGKSAVVVYDFDTNTAVVSSDTDVSLNSEWAIGFTFEDDPQHGYGSWTRNDWWFAYTEPLAYVDGTYSMKQGELITSELINPKTNRILRIVYSYGDQTVNVHEVRVPSCSTATVGMCASPADCGPVEAGTVRAATEACDASCGAAAGCVPNCVVTDQKISLGCANCYADFLRCVTIGCPDACPSQGGNACMSCETDAGCHDSFMACSGLDYMPRGTLTWPL
jgi:hypothetical protein